MCLVGLGTTLFICAEGQAEPSDFVQRLLKQKYNHKLPYELKIAAAGWDALLRSLQPLTIWNRLNSKRH